MKKLVLLTALISSSLMACPDLSGSYTCKQDVGNIDITIVKTNDIPTYKMSVTFDDESQEETLIFDGKERTTSETEGGVTYTYSNTHSCVNDLHIIKFKEVASDNSYSVSGVDQIKKLATGDLEVNSKISYSDIDQTEEESTYPCIKK